MSNTKSTRLKPTLKPNKISIRLSDKSFTILHSIKAKYKKHMYLNDPSITQIIEDLILNHSKK